MRIALGLAAAVALCATLPAHADSGANTGDAGFLDVAQDTVAGRCAYEQVNVPNSSNAVLVVTGHAVATPRGEVRAVATTIRCRLVERYTAAVGYDGAATAEGPAAAVAGAPLARTGSWAVCVEASALYADGALVTTGLRCLSPS